MNERTISGDGFPVAYGIRAVHPHPNQEAASQRDAGAASRLEVAGGVANPAAMVVRHTQWQLRRASARRRPRDAGVAASDSP
mmetsp:Transcript_1308/g.2701  ORF Transcript_1308/g.2701 Transcript_1308/m.2701 type:complete len:82 (-) Transcript_1308:640-885(-)